MEFPFMFFFYSTNGFHWPLVDARKPVWFCAAA